MIKLIASYKEPHSPSIACSRSRSYASGVSLWSCRLVDKNRYIYIPCFVQKIHIASIQSHFQSGNFTRITSSLVARSGAVPKFLLVQEVLTCTSYGDMSELYPYLNPLIMQGVSSFNEKTAHHPISRYLYI